MTWYFTIFKLNQTLAIHELLNILSLPEKFMICKLIFLFLMSPLLNRVPKGKEYCYIPHYIVIS